MKSASTAKIPIFQKPIWNIEFLGKIPIFQYNYSTGILEYPYFPTTRSTLS